MIPLLFAILLLVHSSQNTTPPRTPAMSWKSETPIQWSHGMEPESEPLPEALVTGIEIPHPISPTDTSQHTIIVSGLPKFSFGDAMFFQIFPYANMEKSILVPHKGKAIVYFDDLDTAKFMKNWFDHALMYLQYSESAFESVKHFLKHNVGILVGDYQMSFAFFPRNAPNPGSRRNADNNKFTSKISTNFYMNTEPIGLRIIGLPC